MELPPTCTAPPPTVRGVHQFEIVGYSLIKGFSSGEYVRSGSFAVGGYQWSVSFYPGGFSPPHRTHLSAFLKITSKSTTAWARYDLRLVDPATGLSRSVHRAAEPVVFDYWPTAQPKKFKFKFKSKRGARAFMLRGELEESLYLRGARAFMLRSELEASPYLRGDRLTIECVVDVVVGPWVQGKLRAPPPDLSKHLGDLLDQQDRTDVAFDVAGEVFRAHRAVLAARSPVFTAELYGGMKEEGMDRVAIDDMQPVVFGALIRFVYTDVLVLPGDLEGDEYKEMVRHVLAAADRYGVERLKLICEGLLCKCLDGSSVETTLALAAQHYCKALKEVCVQFMSLGLEA